MHCVSSQTKMTCKSSKLHIAASYCTQLSFTCYFAQRGWLSRLVSSQINMLCKSSRLSIAASYCTKLSFTCYSARRGWLSRLEWVSSDKEEFCRLDRLLISIAAEAGNQSGPEQVRAWMP